MTRTTFAARTLAEQLLKEWPKAKITNSDEPDGLGVHRELQVAQPEAIEIFDVMVPVSVFDPRIISVHLEDGGPMTVTFSGDSKVADKKGAFAIPEVLSIQRGDEPDEVASGEPEKAEVEAEPKPVKKAAAKKKSGNA